VQTNANNCGSCGNNCTGTQICENGTCVENICPTGTADCNKDLDCETNIYTNVSSCGNCGAICTLPNAIPECVGGICQILSCNQNYSNCNNITIDGCETSLLTSPTNCGKCGNSCNLQNAHSFCNSGNCDITSCYFDYANCDGNITTGCEIDLLTDVNNCGSCNNTCNLPNAVSQCVLGECTILECDSTHSDCNQLPSDGCEVNLLNSNQNCGLCGNVCNITNANSHCSSGSCVLDSCIFPYADCNGDPSDGCETNLNSAVNNCGACNNTCKSANATVTCNLGVCAISTCNNNYADCDKLYSNGCEVNLLIEPLHCGSCTTVCSFAGVSSPLCSSGECGFNNCTAGYGNCDAKLANGCETSLQTIYNCGECGNQCIFPNSTAECNFGTCQISSCDPLFGNCDGKIENGCETSFTSIDNCGACGKVCNYPNAVSSCINGNCTIESCTGGMGNCDGNLENGCEVSLDSSINNCGACGAKCNLTNAESGCTNGQCFITKCNTGFYDCDNNPSNGCESTLNDLNNCGACGKVCTTENSNSTCVLGQCVVDSCDPGFANCDSNSQNGCEASLNSPYTCGSCKNKCYYPNGIAACVNGNCTLESCEPGYSDCNNNPSDGCETRTSNSVNNCGGCGIVCNLPNAESVCINSQCNISQCNQGFGNCDNVIANGCEANLTSPLSCGSCGNNCYQSGVSEAECSSGQCVISKCDNGLSNCDGNAANGCESSVLNDLNNCGTCGNVCNLTNAASICSSGECKILTCLIGTSNCNGVESDGCEVTISNDVHNCGVCGNQCTPQYNNTIAECLNSRCISSTCSDGYGNCDGNILNGCEANLMNDSNNCGACSKKCELPHADSICIHGRCIVDQCHPGYANCDGIMENGCEVFTNSDNSHCGGCNQRCEVSNGIGTCNTGICEIQCNIGYGSCSSNQCIHLISVDHCGACGRTCDLPHAISSCTSQIIGNTFVAECVIVSCQDGYVDADGIAENGCELNVRNPEGPEVTTVLSPSSSPKPTNTKVLFEFSSSPTRGIPARQSSSPTSSPTIFTTVYNENNGENDHKKNGGSNLGLLGLLGLLGIIPIACCLCFLVAVCGFVIYKKNN